MTLIASNIIDGNDDPRDGDPERHLESDTWEAKTESDWVTVADATEWLLEHLDSLECEGAEQEQRTAAATAAAEVAAAAHGGAASAPPMPPPPAAALAAASAAAAPPPNEALARLQTAKAMLDARLITAEEYAATKRDILAALAAGGAAPAAAPSPLPPPAADLLDLL